MTICEIQDDDVQFDENKSWRRKYFINRYLKYVINGDTVEALVFDGKSRIRRITMS